jgi:hypothetical protein
MSDRNSRQCKERWFNFLSPDVVNGSWMEEEEILLRTLRQNLGNSWKLIATHFPGRTAINIKSHWQVMQRKNKGMKIMSEPKTSENRKTAPPRRFPVHGTGMPFSETYEEDPWSWFDF